MSLELYEIYSIIFMCSIPFAMGFASGCRVDLARHSGLATIALLSVLPALWLIVKSEFFDHGCPGGECIADGFALIFTGAIALVAVGFLAGGWLRMRRAR